MKHVFAVTIGLLLLSVSVWAEPMYVSDIMKITLRTGPSADHRVIAMLQSGQAVEVITSEGEWTQVKLADGNEGWVISRLLTSDKPKILLFEQTAAKNKALIAQLSDLIDKNNNFQEATKKLENELTLLKKKLQETVHAYEMLQKDSSEILALQSKYKKSARELDVQVRKAMEMEAQIETIRSHQNIKWFLIGAGVLFVGFILGLISKRQRRRLMVF